ncbi:MAG: hypothetical protein JWN78_2213, partial [Bacteroidota bacterium]|nr:hypothetical protein [Bacteroidota bacterium]
MHHITRYFSLSCIILCTAHSFAGKKDKEARNNSSSSPITKKDVEEQALFIEGMQGYLLGNAQDAIA